MNQYAEIRRLLHRVRSRWRALALCRGVGRGALSASLVLAAALAASRVAVSAGAGPLAVAVIGVVALLVAVAALAWGIAPVRHAPSNLRLARFIEERVPSLDDRLATAVDFVESGRYVSSPALAEPLVADAARRAAAIDVDEVLPARRLRSAAAAALVAAAVLLAVLVVSREAARQSADAATLALFPEHVRLQVAPGNVRLKIGAPLTIAAQLVGNRAPVTAVVEVADAAEGPWRRTPMGAAGAGRFEFSTAAVNAGFKYRVVAGSVTSPIYQVAVARAPRVTRIDLEYSYPPSLGLERRTEDDGGDIYAPAGTDVRLRIHTDRQPATARLSFRTGSSLALTSEQPTVLTATVKVAADDGYRVALADSEGLADDGDTEYFIRVLQDRPPEVHIVRPAADRPVTRLEEVEIEARADDDYGIDRLDLVYSVRGGQERVLPLEIPRRAAMVTGRRTLYLEDLDVQPGDFVSYYVRARDVTKSARANEGRSDIFFLEVKPFEQEFALAQSQSMAGSGYNGSIDDLVNAQKQVVVATWKLDRRGRSANGARSDQDVRAVGRTEAELKTRVEETSSSFRESSMRDPRRRFQGGAPPAGQQTTEEDAMTAAAQAMDKAASSLNAVNTAAALPPEMEALNALLKAQAAVKRRQITRQQSAQGGPGNNNRNYDISTLFDKELQRTQQTNYETRSSAEQRQNPDTDALAQIRDLARRQDELLRRQQELARQQFTEEELKRQLEKLTRDQSDLRQQLEDLAQRMASQRGERGQSGQRGAGSANSRDNDRAGSPLRDALEEMRNAASDLRRRDPGGASARSGRALDRLKDAERQMQGDPSAMSDPRRALGDMQLEARQLADDERQVAARSPAAGLGDAAKDASRRLAGEQDRIADRVRRLQDRLKDLSSGAGKGNDAEARKAAADVARELEREHLGERLRKSAEQLRSSQDASPRGKSSAAASQEEMARDLERLADKLGAGAAGDDRDARKTAEQLARAQELRERINSLTRELEKLGQQNRGGGSQASTQKSPGQTGRTGQGQQAGAGGTVDPQQLRDEYARRLQQTRELLDELRRQDPATARGGGGFTFEGQGMTLSAPGTEAFKQDFARWQELRQQATRALDQVESSLSQKLQQQQSRDRLAAGVDDKIPPEYRQQVDTYFKALATKKP